MNLTTKFVLLALFFVAQAISGAQEGCELQVLFERYNAWVVNYDDLKVGLQALVNEHKLDYLLARQAIERPEVKELLGREVEWLRLSYDHCGKKPLVDYQETEPVSTQALDTGEIAKLALAAAGEQPEQQQPVQQTVVVQGGQKSSWLTTALRYASAPLMVVSWPAALATGVASSFTDRGGGKTGDKADKISGRGQAASASVHEPFPGAKVVTRPGYSRITLN